MASDFSVSWQYLSKRTIGFSLRIKLRTPQGHCCHTDVRPSVWEEGGGFPTASKNCSQIMPNPYFL
jgi:hypothetical protein